LLANRLLEAAIPESVGKAFAQDEFGVRFVSRLQKQIFSNSGFRVESLSYFLLMMQLRERSSDRLRFATRLALTPGPSEWNAVRFPPQLFPLYRVVRLARLLGRAVGV
jgi:hypothetical protein